MRCFLKLSFVIEIKFLFVAQYSNPIATTPLVSELIENEYNVRKYVILNTFYISNIKKFSFI